MIHGSRITLGEALRNFPSLRNCAVTIVEAEMVGGEMKRAAFQFSDEGYRSFRVVYAPKACGNPDCKTSTGIHDYLTFEGDLMSTNPFHKEDVVIGACYKVRLHGQFRVVKILGRDPNPKRGWFAMNLNTNRPVNIRSAAKLRSRVDSPLGVIVKEGGTNNVSP